MIDDKAVEAVREAFAIATGKGLGPTLARQLLEAALPFIQEGWQPIESAPKDGTPFLGYWPGGGEWQVPVVGIRWTWWWAAGTGGMFTAHNAPGPQPTLWRPLPEAPK